MEPSPYKCGQCGHTFTHAAPQGDRFVRCPVCDGEVPFHRPAGETGDGERLRVRRDITVDGKSRVCPDCRANVTPGSFSCESCGTVWAEDEAGAAVPLPVQPPRRRRPSGLRRWIAPVALLLAAGGAWLWMRSEGDDPVVHQEERLARFEAERERLRAAADAAHPLWDVGDAVVLQDTVGRTIEGRLAARDEERLIVDTIGGPARVRIDALQPASRFRVDTAFRAREIDRGARRAAGTEND